MANKEEYTLPSKFTSFSSLPSQNHEDSRSPSSFLTSDPPANFAQKPIVKSFSYNMLNAGAPSFLPKTGSSSSFSPKASSSSSVLSKTSSSSSLHGMKKKAKRPPPISLAGTNAMQNKNLYISQQSDPPSPITLAGPPSPITLAGTTTTTTKKTSFVIPQPRGPPTLLHVFTTTTLPSPTSPGPQVFASGNFGASGYNHQDLMAATALSPRPMSPAAVVALSMPPHVDVPKEAGWAGSRKGLSMDEMSRKVLHQVEYYFSDLNVATTDHLMRFMNKDPEGYGNLTSSPTVGVIVPISAVASFKKIRTSTSSISQLVNILRNSEKLIVSDNGDKVKRVNHLTESYMEELKSRIVVAENLPADHCYHNLMKIFSPVGSVKAIRTCQPSNSVASSASRTTKSEGLRPINKLHAFVEYETVEQAEKAVAELTDSKNWRNGLKVRFMVRSQVKYSPPRSLVSGHDNDSSSFSTDSEGDEEGEQKKTRGRDWGKGRGRPQHQPQRNEQQHSTIKHEQRNEQQNSTIKQTSVPRMPDGTRGFSMGRGKLIAARTA